MMILLARFCLSNQALRRPEFGNRIRTRTAFSGFGDQGTTYIPSGLYLLFIMVPEIGVEPIKQLFLGESAVPISALGHLNLVPMAGLEPAKPEISTQYVYQIPSHRRWLYVTESNGWVVCADLRFPLPDFQITYNKFVAVYGFLPLAYFLYHISDRVENPGANFLLAKTWWIVVESNHGGAVANSVPYLKGIEP